MLFSHFSDRIRFVGELKLEHAFVEGLFGEPKFRQLEPRSIVVEAD